MNFYFCETCGKRITEIDIQKGAGKDKKFKGVYCDQCAVGVLTMETLAITDTQAREALKAKAHEGQNATPLSAQAPRPSNAGVAAAKATRQPKPARPPSSDSKTMPIVAAGGAVLVVIGIIVVTQLRGTPPPATRTKPAETAAAIQPETPASQPAAKIEPQPSANRETSKQDPASAEVPRQTTPAANDAESRAQADYDKLTKALEGLDKGDTKGRIELAEAFLKDHRDTIVSSRVSVMLNAWKNPRPQPQPAVAAQSAPAPGADPYFTFDRERGGKWRKDMGKDGYLLFNCKGRRQDEKKLPPYITGLTCEGSMPHDWKLTDERALEDPTGTGRYAHGEYGEYLVLKIKAASEQPYRVSLYAIDGTENKRRQRLEVIPQTGAKRSVDMNDMGNGCWVSFNTAGSQKLTISHVEGMNATVLAVLFDPVPLAPSAPALREDYTLDRKRGGTWINELGKDGYIIFNRPAVGKHDEKLPPYIQRVTPVGAQNYIHSHKDQRVLDAGPGERRFMGVLYSYKKFEVNIDAADQTPRRLSIYLFDVATGRKTRVEVIAAKKTLYSVDVDKMEEGCWLHLETAGSVQLVFTRVGEHTAAVCGLFWDPLPGRVPEAKK